MSRFLLAILLIPRLTLVAGAERDDAPFPPATPASQGVSAQALAELTDIVRGFAMDEAIVGAELLVIKNRCTVLHEAIGWEDRDDRIPLRRDTLFNIRSMTKPITGSAAQILFDEGRLSPGDRVADYLDSFDNDKSVDITVEHLLTHRSGLPMSLLTTLDGIDDLAHVARLGGESGPTFEPGTDFRYSDAGSDSLGAVLEAAAEMKLDQLFEEKIVRPLGMTDTLTLLRDDYASSKRFASAYVGGRGAWARYFKAGEPPLYRFTMGSQGVFCTPTDYARLLALWMDGGRAGGEQVISEEGVRRGLTPVSEMAYLNNLSGTRIWYGQMWMLWVDAEAPDPRAAPLVAFGHNGSDGTWAWAFPEIDLMVLYFTQSRGQGTGCLLEDEIDRLLVHPGRDDLVDLAGLEPYLGTYFDGHARFRVLTQGGRLAVELPQQLVLKLGDPDEEGRRVSEFDERLAFSFVQDASGEVTTMRLHQNGQVVDLPRGEERPEPELDPADVERFLGVYHDPQGNVDVEIVLQNGRLAVKSPSTPIPLEFITPEDGREWRLRLIPSTYITFEVDADGRVLSYIAHVPGQGAFARPRVESNEK